MATDEERRRVAAALRAASGPSLMALMSVLGVGGECLFARLADLMDPDCEEGRYEGVHTARPVDREALLALTRWLDARATDLLKTNSIDLSRRRASARKGHAMDLMAACSLIREALGEEG